jgi:hypothetical protein
MQDFSFDTHIFKEGDAYIAYVPALDVSSCGATDDEARRNIRDAVRGFLSASADIGTLDEILREAGGKVPSTVKNKCRIGKHEEQV